MRNRVKEVRRVKAADVSANAKNFRVHNDHQRQQFRAVLDEVGFAGVSLGYHSARNEGRLTLIDGHMRLEEVAPDFEFDVAVLDVDDAEADKILLSYDWLSSLASIDADKIAALAAEVNVATDAARKTVEAIAAKYREPEAPSEFNEYGEDIETNSECPKCGYKWSASPK